MKSVLKIDLSIILACYNEGPTFEKSVLEIIKILKKTKKNWEIIFVEDKSSDETRKIVEKLVGKIKNSRRRSRFGGQARAIFHKKNEGRGRSVADGIIAARGKICGYLDVDLEVSADYIPIFVSEIERGSTMVVGKRFYEGGLKSLSRFLASQIYTYLVRTLLKIPISDTEAGYKFFKKTEILPVLKKVRDRGWFWDTEICARAYWAGLSISQVPVLFVRRTDKKSTVKLFSASWDYLVKIMKFRNQIPENFLNAK